MHRSSRVARSHTDLWVWQLSQELKVAIDAFIEASPLGLKRNAQLRNRLLKSAATAPQLVAEGFARQLSYQFVDYLHRAEAELNRTLEALTLGCDRGCFTDGQVADLRRRTTRASHAINALIRYLKMANAA